MVPNRRMIKFHLVGSPRGTTMQLVVHMCFVYSSTLSVATNIVTSTYIFGILICFASIGRFFVGYQETLTNKHESYNLKDAQHKH